MSCTIMASIYHQCWKNEFGSTPATVVHAAALGFDSDCSLKPPPGRDLFKQLSEHILQDGFLTSGEPLLVVQSRPEPEGPDGASHATTLKAPWPSQGPGPSLAATSLGYLKGMARVTTTLVIIHRAWKLNLDMRVAPQKLCDSILTIYVHHVEQASKLDEALQNMKLSARGSIRKKTNLIQIVMMVSKLQTFGMSDFIVFVKKWNGMAVRSDQLIGRRAVAMKLLLDQSPQASPTCMRASVVVNICTCTTCFCVSCMSMGSYIVKALLCFESLVMR